MNKDMIFGIIVLGLSIILMIGDQVISGPASNIRDFGPVGTTGFFFFMVIISYCIVRFVVFGIKYLKEKFKV